MKPRDDYFGIAVHEGEGDSDSDGEPILSVKDRDDPILNPLVRCRIREREGSRERKREREREEQRERGFFIRLKPRDNYFGIAVNEGEGDSDSDGEPILSVKDRDDPILNPLVRCWKKEGVERGREREKEEQIKGGFYIRLKPRDFGTLELESRRIRQL